MSEGFAPPTALVVDGDPHAQEALQPVLATLGLAAAIEPDPQAAVAWLARARPDVVLVALDLVPTGSVAVVRAAQAYVPGLPVLLLVAPPAQGRVPQAIGDGAVDWIGKPIVAEEARVRISSALAASRAARDRATLEALHTTLQVSSPTDAVLACVAQAARGAMAAATATVFVLEDGRLGRVAGDEPSATLAAVAAQAVATRAPAARAGERGGAVAVPVLIDGAVAGALGAEGPGAAGDPGPLAPLAARAAVTLAEARDRTRLRLVVRAALARVASQIAHELNNPLGGLKLYMSLLERQVAQQEEPGRSIELVRKVIRAVDDLAARVGEIRAYERGADAVGVHQLIESCLDECLARGNPPGRGGAGGA